MVKPDVVSKKVTRASAWLDNAETLVSLPPKEFLSDVKSRDLATFYLFLAIQECIDLAAHWVADAGWGSPEDAASTFDVLADHDVIDHELATQLRGAVGLRNRIAHGYASVDHARVQSEFREGAESLRRFLALLISETGL
ncbi:MAG TPA: DUF86 domain-containing protein [Thermoanaerobaculia bacterium]